MVHVFRLGPFQVGRRDAYAYGGIDGAGAIVRPEVAHSDEEGLAAFAKRHPGPLRCEPALAAAGATLGFEPRPLPEDALLPRAVLTYGLAVGGSGLGAPPLDLLLRFFEACAAYWEATPWGLVGSDDPIPVVFETGRGRRDAEASVLGAGGAEFGLALYDEPGSIARVAAAVSRGKLAETRPVASTSVTFDAEPTWAAEVFLAAFDLPRLPVALRIRNGKAVPAGTDDLRSLTAALEAMVAMLNSDDLDPGTATVEAGGTAVTAHVSFPDDLYDDLEEDDADLADPIPVPEPLAPVRRAERIPRNAPCPCGSGRKYKKCHLAEDEERERAATGTGPAAEVAREQARRLAERDPIHALSERITADALALARRRLGKGFAPEQSLKDLGLTFEASQMLLGWCSDHYRGPTGETALDLYLAERGGALDDEGRRLTAALRSAWFSYHEVIAAEPGVSVTLRDMLAGGERLVQERTASRTVRARDVVLARVLDLGDRCILAGCHPRSLPPREGDLACRLARKALRTRAKTIPSAKLRELTADGTLLLGWQDLVQAIDARPPPRLQNTDGEDLLLTIDRFAVAAGKSDEVATGLLSLPDARRDDDDVNPRTVEISFVREGNAKGLLPATLIGRAILEGNALRLETNSVARADRLRKLVEDRLGTQVLFRLREHADPMAAPNRSGVRSKATPDERLPPEAIALVRQMKAEHQRKWLDEEIPALRGLTPREAARTKGAPREALRLLLSEMEHAEARQPAELRMDVAALRRELGVE